MNSECPLIARSGYIARVDVEESRGDKHFFDVTLACDEEQASIWSDLDCDNIKYRQSELTVK